MTRISNNELVKLSADLVVAETTKAFLILIDDREIWFPKSQIRNENGGSAEEGIYVNDEDVIFLCPEWFVIDKELENLAED